MPGKRVYLDYAATTPVDKRVQKVMQPFLDTQFGNASSLHSFGRDAKAALEGARATLARALNASPGEIVFTASDTESNNLIIKGVAVRRALATGRTGHIILSAVEHDSTVEIAESLQRWGYAISYAPVDKSGQVDIDALEKLIQADTFLVSVIFASNEIGTIQPIKEIGRLCKEKGILFHTDASQTFGKMKIDVKALNIDLLSASSHKIYGPKGAALAYVRAGVKLEPLVHGGGQEGGLRGGTENVAAIVGFAKAAEIYAAVREKETKDLEKLRALLVDGILKIPGAHVNGSQGERLPGLVNAWFQDVNGELLVAALDAKGFAVSTGSACSTVHMKTSHILLAIGLSKEQADGSLRVSMGRQTTTQDIKAFISTLSKILTRRS